MREQQVHYKSEPGTGRSLNHKTICSIGLCYMLIKVPLLADESVKVIVLVLQLCKKRLQGRRLLTMMCRHIVFT